MTLKCQNTFVKSAQEFPIVIPSTYGNAYFNCNHPDLKQENLLLDKYGNICIADLSMAVLEPKGRLLETSCGSPHFTVPEIVAGKNL